MRTSHLKLGDAMNSPSKAWLDSVFSSGPRRDLKTKNKSSTRTAHKTELPGFGGEMYAQGDHHLVALKLLEHLWRCGQVKRFKAEAFDLLEIGGPALHVVDILVEDKYSNSHIIQVKSKNYLTKEVEEVLEEERIFLTEKGFSFHVWTSGNVLAPPGSHSIRYIDDQYKNPPSKEVLDQIGADVRNGFTSLYQLLNKYGWEDSISAAAHLIYHVDITKKLNENSPIQPTIPDNFYAYLIASRSRDEDWWSTLKNTEIQEQ